ncbi:MAG: presqualene diphosphate synthase HpnD [SAR202 cluster bacterium]|nr:presqualene diphosphate synthase HpnD [SAR202 cluster bacterium]
MTSEIETAYAHCEQVTREQARNFFYAFRTLPAHKRRSIYAAYAFARECDDASDEDIPVADKQAALTAIREQLRAAEAGRPEGPMMTALADSAKTFDIPFSYLHEVVDGVEMDLTWNRYKNFEELRQYCYRVASVIGLISIQIFGYQGEKAREYAIDLGLAMQLTNIMRDVKEDARRGRIYLPLDELRRFGYAEDELMRGVVNDSFRKLMAFQAQRARSYFASGLKLLPLLSRDSRACPAVLGGVYAKVLDRIEQSGFQVFEKRIGLSKWQKVFIMLRLWARSLMPRVLASGG